jgi:predicted nucleic acid-binding protein
MKVVFDTAFLVVLLDESVVSAHDPRTNGPIDRPKERLNHLITELEKQRAKIVIPTPALAEVLANAGPALKPWLDIIAGHSVFQIEPFDTLAAVEAAIMFDQARARGDWKDGSASPKQKIKVDRQIAAIARRHGAQRLYTNDADLEKVLGPGSSISVVYLSELPLPAEDPQLDMLTDLEGNEAANDDVDD